MAKLKLTKNELKKQKDDLKRFNRYLPTLILKKQQLQMEIQKVEHAHQEKEKQLNRIRESVSHWVDVFGEDIRVEEYVKMAAVNIEHGNVAGIDIPIFKSIEFQEVK
jgi:V/A-type H+-transporting ATPase subunit D